MTPQEFIDLAENKLNPDPKSRLTSLTRQLIENQKCVFDVHCHVFDRKCIKVDYFLLRLAASPFKLIIQQYLKRKANALQSTRLTKIFLDEDPVSMIYSHLESEPLDDRIEEQEWNEIESLLSGIESDLDQFNFNETSSLNAITLSNLLAACKVILKGDMRKVYDHYVDHHSLSATPEHENSPFVTIVLMMDLEQGWGRKTRKSYIEQVQELNIIASECAVLPFLALDPRREDLYEIFLEAFCSPNSHFFGVKTYPSFGYSPSDGRLHPIYAICQQFKIPLTTHCGGTTVSTFHSKVSIRECTSYDQCKIKTISGTRKDIARQLNEPDGWELVLECFPNLKVNFGHFGGGDAWVKFSKDGSGRVDIIRNLMTKDGVYADFSFNLEDPELDELFLKGLNSNPTFQERSMFGTDFWVVLPSTNLVESTSRFLNYVRIFEDQMFSLNPKQFLLK